MLAKDVQGRILVHESTDDGVRAGQYAFGTAKVLSSRPPRPSASAAPLLLSLSSHTPSFSLPSRSS